MSKSRGNVVDPNKMVDEFGADAFRYFLRVKSHLAQDGDFPGSGYGCGASIVTSLTGSEIC